MTARMMTGALLGISLIAATGCAEVLMENTSPIKAIPTVEPFQVIPATILVSPGKPGELSHNDLAKALKKEDVFTEIVTTAAGEKPQLELVVTSETDDDGHFGAEMLKAVLVGLTLSTTSGMAADKHDYTVTLQATLYKGGKELARYTATGSYHSEMPETRAIEAKVEHVKKTVKLSWEHALGLVVAAIKQDRAKIVGP